MNDLFKNADPTTKTAISVLGLTVLILTGVYYYHQIKLTKLKIKQEAQ